MSAAYIIGTNDIQKFEILKNLDFDVDELIGNQSLIELASWNNNLDFITLLTNTVHKDNVIKMNLILKHPHIVLYLLQHDFPYDDEDISLAIQFNYLEVLCFMDTNNPEVIEYARLVNREAYEIFSFRKRDPEKPLL